MQQNRKPRQQSGPPVAGVFQERASLLGRPIEVATIKLERLIAIPGGIDSAGGGGQNQQLQPLPVSPNYMIDVDRLVERQKEIRRLDAFIAANPTSAESHYQRANLHYSVSDFDRASQDYSRTIELRPDLAAAWINRGAIRRKSGDISGAIIDYDQAIALAPSDSDAYRNRGIARELIGDLDGALSDWERAARLGDQDASQWVALARPKLPVNLNLEMLTRMHSPNVGPAASHAPVKPMVIPTALTGRLKQLTLALASKPRDPQLLLQRGTELLKTGQPDQAIIDFTSVLQASPNSQRAMFNRAVARRKIGDLNGALADYDRAIQLAPKDRDAYRNRGIVKQMLGSLSGACADWGMALALGDQEVKTWIRDECR